MGLIVVLVIGAVLGLAVLLKSVSPEKVSVDPNIKGENVAVRDYSHMTGSPNAKVTLIEFGDYQCPFCAQAYTPVSQVVDKYKTNPDFNFTFRHFPLSQHAGAMPAAQAAEAAASQGKFWEMNGLIYTKQSEWSGTVNPTSYFTNYAQQLGLDMNKFKSEVAAGSYINNIRQDEADGQAWGVNSTPTFILNGEKVNSYSDLDAKIGALLAK